MIRQGLDYNKLLELVDNDKEKANGIWEVSKMVISYTQTKSVLELGLNINFDSLPFQKVMLFSWIKEELANGRKT